MPDLRVTFGSIEFKNPFVVASASTSKKLKQVKAAEEAGAGGVILKAIVTKHPYFTMPRYYQDPKGGAHFCPMDPRLLVDEGVELIKACKREARIPIIANTMGSGGNLDSWADISKKLADAGADMIELNLGCPNIGVMQKTMGQLTGEEDEVLGAVVGQSPTLAGKIVKAVRATINIPIMVKLTPLAADMVAVADACLKAGADTLDVSNAQQGIPGVNIYDDGKPLFKNFYKMPIGGTGGPASKKFTLKNTAQICLKIPNVEIAGSGGLMDWKDCVEFFMLGGKVATHCTNIMWYGWDVFKDLNAGLEKYMSEMGYKTLDDFRGCALKYFTTPDKAVFKYVVAQINESKCSRCGLCSKGGHCDAIEMINGKPVVTKENCVGCANCADICPCEAIDMVEDPAAYKGINNPAFAGSN